MLCILDLTFLKCLFQVKDLQFLPKLFQIIPKFIRSIMNRTYSCCDLQRKYTFNFLTFFKKIRMRS